MPRKPKFVFLAAMCFPLLAACGTQSQGTPASGSSEADRIIARETRNARRPDESRGIEIRRLGFQKLFAGTAMQYSATFKGDNLIDLGLKAHRLEGQEMLQSGATLTNLPMGEGDVAIDADQGGKTPMMTLTGVPGYEKLTMRMRQGTVRIVSLDHEKDSFTQLPVINGFELTFEGHFLAFSEDPDYIVTEPEGNRGVPISGAVRFHKE